MNSILITGENGFVAKHLIRSLHSKGYSITGVSKIIKKKQDYESIALNLVDYDYIKNSLSKNRDIIVHLASIISVDEMIKNTNSTVINNITSTLNLLEDIRLNNKNCRLIFLSSDKVYGNANNEVFEESKTNPSDPYGYSKLISEQLIELYHKNYGLKYTIIRSGNIFGEEQNSRLFIPSVITKIIEKNKTVTVGNLEPFRNFVYIKDLISALLKVIDNKNSLNKTFNIASYNLKILEVFNEIKKIATEIGFNFEVLEDKTLYRAIENKDCRFILNTEKAKEVLEWKPEYSFEEAIRKTFNSYLVIT